MLPRALTRTPSPPPPPSFPPTSASVSLTDRSGGRFVRGADGSGLGARPTSRSVPRRKSQTAWSDDHRTLTLLPSGRWQTDRRYLVTVAASAKLAQGAELGEDRVLSFTTQTAPSVSEFEVRLLSDHAQPQFNRREPGDARSPTTSPTARCSATHRSSMRRSTRWTMPAPRRASASPSPRQWTRPTSRPASASSPGFAAASAGATTRCDSCRADRLKADTRYAVTLVGAHDAAGNRLGGDVSFSFTTRADAELIRFTPERHATDVQAKQVDARASASRWIPTRPRDAVRVINLTTGRRDWRPRRLEERRHGAALHVQRRLAARQPDRGQPRQGRQDKDGNAVSISWTFRTPPASARPRNRQSTRARRRARQHRDLPRRPTCRSSPCGRSTRRARDYGFAPTAPGRGHRRGGLGPRVGHAELRLLQPHRARRLDQARIGCGGQASASARPARTSATTTASACARRWSGATPPSCRSRIPAIANHIGNILSPHYSRLGIGIAAERRQGHHRVGLRRLANPVRWPMRPAATALRRPHTRARRLRCGRGMRQTRCYTP